MAVNLQITLPLVKITPGSLKYALDDPTTVPVGTVYVRKDKLRDAGHEGIWPTEVTVTVEVP